jgi:hypothetical protein
MAMNFKQPLPLLELLGIIMLAVVGVVLAHYINLFEILYQWSRGHEEWQLDEVFTAFIVFTIGLSIFSWRRWREQVREHDELIRLMAEKTKMIIELQEAADKIKVLRGFLPICAHCKKIRDDEGYWQQVEKYISEHSEAQFSHGICPSCAKEHYAELLSEEEKSLP